MCVALTILLASSAAAQTLAAPLTVDGYLATRDEQLAHFEKFRDGGGPPAVYDAELTARNDLQRLLQAVLGNSRVSGFPGPGKISLQTLIPDPTFGRLDGLEWESKDLNARLLVTNDALLSHWLATGTWLSKLPKDHSQLLQSQEFFAFALFDDISVLWYAKLPVKPAPGSTFTRAFLALATADTFDTAVPDRIEIVVVKTGRIYLIDATSKTQHRGIPACTKIAQDYENRTTEPFSMSRFDAASPTNKEIMAAERDRLWKEGDRALRQCYATRLPQQSAFQTLLAEAQLLVDRVESK